MAGLDEPKVLGHPVPNATVMKIPGNGLAELVDLSVVHGRKRIPVAGSPGDLDALAIIALRKVRLSVIVRCSYLEIVTIIIVVVERYIREFIASAVFVTVHDVPVRQVWSRPALLKRPVGYINRLELIVREPVRTETVVHQLAEVHIWVDVTTHSALLSPLLSAAISRVNGSTLGITHNEEENVHAILNPVGDLLAVFLAVAYLPRKIYSFT